MMMSLTRLTKHFMEKKFEAIADKRALTNAQQAQAKLEQEKVKAKVQEHYQRAMQLVKKGRISEENYDAADQTVRQLVESIYPGRGNAITESFIAKLGEDSEKVIYKVGIDPAEQTKLINALRNDPSAIEASMNLGSLKERLSTAITSKRVSGAPKPKSKISGDGAIVAKTEAKLKKAYLAAVNKDPQKAFKILREAKAKGFAPHSW